MPAFVFGLVPAGVVEAEGELTGGTRTPRSRVITTTGDGSYAIELEPGQPPLAVIGHRADGTTVRYALRP